MKRFKFVKSRIKTCEIYSDFNYTIRIIENDSIRIFGLFIVKRQINTVLKKEKTEAIMKFNKTNIDLSSLLFLCSLKKKLYM